MQFAKDVQVEWIERHAKVLSNLLSCFEEAGVRYVILKNDAGLPYVNNAKDVDIVIEPGKYRIAEKIIRKCYKDNDIKYYNINRFERLRCWYGVDIDNRFAIHIDLLEGFLHKGFEMFPFEVLINNSHKNENGINVLNDTMSAVVLLLHSAICYHSIKIKYAKYIYEVYNTGKSSFESILYNILGDSCTQELMQLIEKNEFKEIEKIGNKLSKASKFRLLLKRPLFSLYNLVDFLWEKTCRSVFNLEKYTGISPDNLMIDYKRIINLFQCMRQMVLENLLLSSILEINSVFSMYAVQKHLSVYIIFAHVYCLI